MKRILVTGFNGFVGRHLCRSLLDAGYEVVGIDNYSTSEEESWEGSEKILKIKHDISENFDSNLPELIGKVDAIIHLAALARVQPSFENPVRWNDVNVTGTLKLLLFAKSIDCKRFVFASSSSVYSDSALVMRPEYDNWYEEDALQLLKPISPYALQKLMAERYIEMFADEDCSYISLRLFNVYGEDQPVKGQYPQAIPTWREQFKNGEKITLYGDGNTKRDFTYVGDVVNAFMAAMTYSPESGYDCFNIGTGESYKMISIINAISGVQDYPILWLPYRNEPKITLADNRKAEDLLGWKNKTYVINWLVENRTK